MNANNTTPSHAMRPALPQAQEISQHAVAQPAPVTITPGNSGDADLSPADRVPYATVVVFDIVQSRAITAVKRRQTQETIEHVLSRWNADYDFALLAGFMTSLGDEYQGLLSDPAIIPDLMWELEEACPKVSFHWGIGYGAIHTRMRRTVTAMDGPTFHNARAAIAAAKKDNRSGGVYVGFPTPIGDALNGIARLLFRQRARLTAHQREGLRFMRRGLSATQAAAELGITRQAMDQRTRSGGWSAYEEGERAHRTLLRSCSGTHERANAAAEPLHDQYNP